MLPIMHDELVEQLTAVISLPNGYSVLAKSKKYLALYCNLKEATRFLVDTAKAKERCYYVLNGLSDFKKCKCGCDGTLTNYQSDFLQNHSHRDPNVKEKWQVARRITMQNKYGEDLNKIYEKQRATNLAKYGTECAFANATVKLKIQETITERYGVNNISQLDQIKQQKKQTYTNNYGTIYNGAKEVNDRIRKARHKNTYKRFSRFADVVTPLFKEDEFIGGGDDQQYQWMCCICKTAFQTTYDDGLIPRCKVCKPNESAGAIVQEELHNFLCTLTSDKIEVNTRRVITPFELDFYIPSKALAIEYNGLYWHTLQRTGYNTFYHLHKTQQCAKLGIKLIHIFEDEWVNQKEIVKSRLAQHIGNKRDNVVFARKCKVVTVSAQDKNAFLKEHHLQGADKSSIYYGLTYNDKLVSVMTFGRPRFNKKYQYELIRFASCLDYNVVGAGGRLLAHFVKSHSPQTIISYADFRWSSYNNIYKILGFELLHRSNPNYWYTKNGKRLSRYTCQKQKLAKLLPEFNVDLSEEKNMAHAGYEKIYDCGNLVYILNI